MSHFSAPTNKERNILILALETMLNNVNCFTNINDRIYITRQIPSVIKKLKSKEETNGKDWYILSLSLEYIHKALTGLEPITADDQKRIKPHQAMLQMLYEQYGFICHLEDN